ncbi:MAG: DUF3846 domain-containing protein [Oscillospiraceae bacterium]|nr:DUF3846 domain-containing protein [Oscillospiraceae bacterium]
MQIIVVRPFTQPKVEEIENTLEAKQAIVGGYIQAIYPWEDEIALICNEEGKLLGLPINRFLWSEDGEPVDYIAGTFLICGAPIDSEGFESIPDKLIDKYIKLFQF